MDQVVSSWSRIGVDCVRGQIKCCGGVAENEVDTEFLEVVQ